MMNPQEHRRSLMNSLIFAGSSLLMIVLGSLAGSLIKSQLVLHVNQVIAALILFALGCFLLIQAFRQKAFEERHDESFNYKKVLILGLAYQRRRVLAGHEYDTASDRLDSGMSDFNAGYAGLR